MQYNDTSTKQGIIQDISFLLGNSVDLNTYTIEDRTRNVNLRFQNVWHVIFEAYGGWEFMDTNVSGSDTPYADVTFGIGNYTITLPSQALTVKGIEVTTPNNGAQLKLKGLTREEFLEMGGESLFNTANITGIPQYYLIYGDKIVLLYRPNYAGTARIYFDEGISEFDTADTTKEPGFAKPFHRILSVGGALDYASTHGMIDKASFLTALWNEYEARISLFYSQRYLERYPKKIPPTSDLVEEFR